MDVRCTKHNTWSCYNEECREQMTWFGILNRTENLLGSIEMAISNFNMAVSQWTTVLNKMSANEELHRSILTPFQDQKNG